MESIFRAAKRFIYMRVLLEYLKEFFIFIRYGTVAKVPGAELWRSLYLRRFLTGMTVEFKI